MCNTLCMTEMPRFDQSAPLGVPEFDLADRMRKALRESKIGVQELADYLEVARETVSTWINGRVTPNGQTIRLVAMRTGVNYRWLKDGVTNGPDKGEVRREGLEPPTRWLRGITGVTRIRRKKKPEIIPGYGSIAA